MGIKIKGIEISVVKVKAGEANAQVIVNAAENNFSKDIRNASYKALIGAHKNKNSSVVFCGLDGGVRDFSCEESSKIIAQEVFRYIRKFSSPAVKKIIFILSSQKAFRVFNKNVCRYLEYINKKVSQGPFVTVDGIVEYEGGIVMVERSNPPFGWALPGGFVDYGESVEDAVVREIKEETNLDFLKAAQFKVYSHPKRDPRFHTVSVVFVGKGKGTLKADSDAKSAAVFKLDALPEKIAFDHSQIIKEYMKNRR